MQLANKLTTVFDGSNAELVESLLSLCFRGTPTILDVTYGSGMFWKGSARNVVGCDKNQGRSRNVVCDFTRLPFPDGAFDVVVFDPPFQPKNNISPGNIIELRFTKVPGGTRGVRQLVDAGLKEAWRVSRLGVIYKCQDYIDARKPVWMSLWAYDLLGPPYEMVYRRQPSKLTSSKWKTQQSARRNHTNFMVWTRKNIRVWQPHVALP